MIQQKFYPHQRTLTRIPTVEGSDSYWNLNSFSVSQILLTSTVSLSSFLDLKFCEQHVLEKERKGDYLGKTIQVVPHINGAIQEWIERQRGFQLMDRQVQLMFVSLNLEEPLNPKSMRKPSKLRGKTS